MHPQRPFSRLAVSQASSFPSRSFVRVMARTLIVALTTLGGITAARAGEVVSVETTGVTSGAIFSVTATGLDATASQNAITFTPSAGAPVVVPASSSALVDATRGVRRLSVRMPGGIAVGPAAVVIRNMASGETTNAGTIQVLELSVPDPARATIGRTGLAVRLRASDATRFVAGQTRVTFGAQVRVASVAVVSSNELVATIDIAATAAAGPRAVSVTVPRQSLVLANGFTVDATEPPPPTNHPPTARFTFAPASPTVNQSVAFDGTSSSDPDAGDTLTYAWTFGDGATATGATAAHAYAAAGPFTVTLTVTDGHGGSASATQTVTVSSAPPPNQAPTARFTFAPGSPTVNQSVAFDGTSSSDPDAGDTLTHAWTFGDGATATGATAAHAYAAAGPFTVTLTVTDGHGGSASATQTVTVTSTPPPNQAPTARFTFAPASPTVNQSVAFDGTSSSDPDAGDTLTYAWTFGDGATATGATAAHAYAAAGPFTVTLTVTDGHGGSASATQTVTVSSAPPPNQAPTARFTFAPGSPTVNQSVAFDGTSSSDPDAGDTLTHAWTFGDGRRRRGRRRRTRMRRRGRSR